MRKFFNENNNNNNEIYQNVAVQTNTYIQCFYLDRWGKMFIVRQFSAIFAFVLLFDVTTIYTGSFILKQMIHLLWFQTELMVFQNQSWELRAAWKYQRWDFDLCDNIMFLFCLNNIICIQKCFIARSPKHKNDDRLYILIFIHIPSFFLVSRQSWFRKRTRKMFMIKVSKEIRDIHKIQASKSRVLGTWRYKYCQRMCKLSDNNNSCVYVCWSV